MTLIAALSNIETEYMPVIKAKFSSQPRCLFKDLNLHEGATTVFSGKQSIIIW